MADEIQAKVRLGVTGDKDVQNAFDRIGKSVNSTSLNISTMINVFQQVTRYAEKIGAFFIDSAMAASDSARQFDLMRGRVVAVGIEFDKVSPQIVDYTNKMLGMGVADEDVNRALGRFVIITKSVDEAIRLTTLASDLAVNNFGDMASNVDLIEKIMIGRGIRALTQYGIHLKDNASITEQLAAVQSKIILTTEQFARTTEGSIRTMKTQWSELKERMGELISPTLLDFMDQINMKLGEMDSAGQKVSVTLGEKIKRKFEELRVIWATFIQGNTGKPFFQQVIENLSWLQRGWEMEATAAEEAQKKKDEALKKSGASSNDWADDTSAAADKIKKTFEEMSKDIISSLEDQSKAIKGLEDDWKSLEEKHDETLKDMARSSSKNIENIDKQIADEQATRNKGWRTRIADLEAERAKEKSIIARIGGEIINLEGEIAKDELTRVEEEYQNASAKIEEQILERRKFTLEKQVQINQPGFFDKYIGEKESTAGAIGISPIQQSFVFNFNGDVNDKDALMQAIIDIINRQAILRGYQ